MAQESKGILDFFLRIFGRDSDDRQKKKKLQEIYKFLKGVKPSIYKKGSNEVQSGFATNVHNFFKLLSPLCEVFQNSINNPDRAISDMFHNRLIGHMLPSQFRERRLKFSYEEMNERVQNAIAPDEELKKISAEFDELIEIFKQKEISIIDLYIHELYKLSSLCAHDFESLLKRFDSRMELYNPGYKPSFNPVRGDSILAKLLDIYFILANFNNDLLIDKRFHEQISFLTNSLSKGATYSHERALGRIHRILQNQLSENTLLALIRAVKREPEFMPEKNKEPAEYMTKYVRKLIERYNKDRDRILRALRERNLEKEIEGLFGKGVLLNLQGYGPEENKYLQEAGFDGFVFVKPLQIIKTFLVAKFEKNIRDNLKVILVEGFFESKVFQADLSNLLYRCERSFDYITEFEESLLSAGSMSLELLNRMVVRHKRGKNSEIQIKRVLESIESRAGRLVEEETNALYRLARMLQDILQDYKKPAPEYVTNIKTIRGSNNREYVAALVGAHNDFSKFLRMMKNFTVLKASQVRTAKSKTSNPKSPQAEAAQSSSDM